MDDNVKLDKLLCLSLFITHYCTKCRQGRSETGSLQICPYVVNILSLLLIRAQT